MVDTDAKQFMFNAGRAAVQATLDFDHACGRERPSIAGIIKPGSSAWMNYHWGDGEVLIETFPSIEAAFAKHPEVSAVVNFASERSAYAVAREFIDRPEVRYQTIIAEGMPEREVRQLRVLSKKAGQMIIGPATFGCFWAGVLKLGNASGTLELQAEAHIHEKGSVVIVTKSGGILNEVAYLVGNKTQGVHTAIAVGGDSYPCTSLLDVCLMYELDAEIKMIVLFGEVGGRQELEVVQALKEGKITKPVVAWVSGLSGEMLPKGFQFGHAGAQAKSEEENARAKNDALTSAGAHVPESYEDFDDLVVSVADSVRANGRSPVQDDFDLSLYENRKPLSGIVSTISDDTGSEAKYLDESIVDVASDGSRGVADVVGMLWLRRKLPPVALKFITIILKLVADHGPSVSGAHNTIVASRAGKDLVSSFASGLLTIGPRFGGATGEAAGYFLDSVREGSSPRDFVERMKGEHKNIPGIGHRVKSKVNPDARVTLLKGFAAEHLTDTPHFDFALGVEEITLQKKHNLILNIDGCIAAVALDVFAHVGFSDEEMDSLVRHEVLDGLFVLGRSVGLIGHHIDQKRLGSSLYRHPTSDTTFWNEEDL